MCLSKKSNQACGSQILLAIIPDAHSNWFIRESHLLKQIFGIKERTAIIRKRLQGQCVEFRHVLG